jgi:hypothetical protein
MCQSAARPVARTLGLARHEAAETSMSVVEGEVVTIPVFFTHQSEHCSSRGIPRFVMCSFKGERHSVPMPESEIGGGFQAHSGGTDTGILEVDEEGSSVKRP